jgi:hypothetical protein
MAAGRQPPSRDDILEAALAALTEDDIPPDDDCPGRPDPDSGPPPELADLTTPELQEPVAAEPAPAAEMGRPGSDPQTGRAAGAGLPTAVN